MINRHESFTPAETSQDPETNILWKGTKRAIGSLALVGVAIIGAHEVADYAYDLTHQHYNLDNILDNE
jgi:hypothetical protein